MVHHETRQENEIIFDHEEKEVKSNSTLEVVLPTISQIYSYALNCPNLGILVNTTKEALLSLMSKLRNKTIHHMFSWMLGF